MTSAPAAPTLDITAYRIPGLPAMELVPAPAGRDWMEDGAYGRVAQLCLGLRIANQLGWFLLNAGGFRARWDGGPGIDAVQVRPLSDAPLAGFSTFGRGKIGWVVPVIRDLADNAEIADGYRRWAAERAALIERIGQRTPTPAETSRAYIRAAKQKKLAVRPFGRST